MERNVIPQHVVKTSGRYLYIDDKEIYPVLMSEASHELDADEHIEFRVVLTETKRIIREKINATRFS